MSILGDIGERLTTDLGELGRAVVDPEFSRRRDIKMFEADRHLRDRKEALEDSEKIRQQKLADQEARDKLTLQMDAVNKIFDLSLDSGNWGPFSRLLKNPNLVDLAKNQGIMLNNAHGSKSLERIDLEEQWKNDAANLKIEKKQLLLSQNKFTNEKNEFMATFLLDEWKERFKLMQDIRETHEKRNNRQSMIEFVKNTPDIDSPTERESFVNQLRQASPDQVLKIWDEIMKRSAARLDEAGKNARNKASNEATVRAAQTISPSSFDEGLAKDIVSELIPQYEDMRDDQNS